MIIPFIFVLEHPAYCIHFFACLLSFNTSSLELWWPITITFCVPCTSTWKHNTSSLWMNTSNLIFWLFCIHNLSKYLFWLHVILHVHILLTMPINLLTILIHLLTIPRLVLIVPTNPLTMSTHIMIVQIHMLIQLMPLMHQLQISIYQILFFYNYHSMICLSSEVLKSILFWPQDLPSIFFRCPISMVSMLHSLHLPPLYQSPPLGIHLHFIPSILAFVVFVFEL